jgi:hypothetical protein
MDPTPTHAREISTTGRMRSRASSIRVIRQLNVQQIANTERSQMEPETYTKISVETKYPDGEVAKVTLSTSRWDMGAWDFYDTCINLMRAVGYADESINALTGLDDGDNEDEYGSVL